MASQAGEGAGELRRRSVRRCSDLLRIRKLSVHPGRAAARAWSRPGSRLPPEGPQARRGSVSARGRLLAHMATQAAATAEGAAEAAFFRQRAGAAQPDARSGGHSHGVVGVKADGRVLILSTSWA